MKGQAQFNESWGKHQKPATQKQTTRFRCINPRDGATGNVSKVVFIRDGKRIESINGVEAVIGTTKINRRVRY